MHDARLHELAGDRVDDGDRDELDVALPAISVDVLLGEVELGRSMRLLSVLHLSEFRLGHVEVDRVAERAASDAEHACSLGDTAAQIP